MASGIAETHHLGTFVECLAYSVVYGLSEDFILERTVHPDDLRVSS